MSRALDASMPLSFATLWLGFAPSAEGAQAAAQPFAAAVALGEVLESPKVGVALKARGRALGGVVAL